MPREYGKAMRVKLTHEKVDYGPGHKDRHCSLCTHYQIGSDLDKPHCSVVLDPIAPDMWCKKFRRY